MAAVCKHRQFTHGREKHSHATDGNESNDTLTLPIMTLFAQAHQLLKTTIITDTLPHYTRSQSLQVCCTSLAVVL